jgi:hypothetical protein
MMIIDEIRREVKGLSPGRRELRQLGLVFFGALVIIGGLLWLRDRPVGPYFMAAGIFFGLMGLAWPRGLKWLYKPWMALALVLGHVMSRLILTLLFYLVVTPIGLVLRLMGKDLLDRKWNGRESYWRVRDDAEYEPRQTEKMY